VKSVLLHESDGSLFSKFDHSRRLVPLMVNARNYVLTSGRQEVLCASQEVSPCRSTVKGFERRSPTRVPLRSGRLPAVPCDALRTGASEQTRAVAADLIPLSQSPTYESEYWFFLRAHYDLGRECLSSSKASHTSA
jgi:hypothetical protein